MKSRRRSPLLYFMENSALCAKNFRYREEKKLNKAIFAEKFPHSGIYRDARIFFYFGIYAPNYALYAQLSRISGDFLFFAL